MTLRKPSEREDSLTVKLGSLFEAHATGRGVLAVPIVVLMVVAAAVVAKLILSR